MSAEPGDASDRKLASRNGAEMTASERRARANIKDVRDARDDGLGDLSASPSLHRLIPYPGRRDVMFYSSKTRQPAKSTTIGIAIRRGRRRSCNYAFSKERHNNTTFNDDLPLLYVPRGG